MSTQYAGGRSIEQICAPGGIHASNLGANSVTASALSSSALGFGLTGGSGSPAAVDSTVIATISYVQTYVQGLDVHEQVEVATAGSDLGATFSTSLGGSFTGAPNVIDGYTLSVNDRVLVKDQTVPAQNGIYSVTSLGAGPSTVAMQRSSDATTLGEFGGSGVNLPPGSFTFVTGGTFNIATGWVFTYPISPAPVINTTSLTVSRFSGGSLQTSYSIGNTITTTGSPVSITKPTSDSTAALLLDVTAGTGPAISITFASGATGSGILFGIGGPAAFHAITGPSDQTLRIFAGAGQYMTLGVPSASSQAIQILDSVGTGATILAGSLLVANNAFGGWPSNVASNAITAFGPIGFLSLNSSSGVTDAAFSRLGSASIAAGNGTSGDFSGTLKFQNLYTTNSSSLPAGTNFTNSTWIVAYDAAFPLRFYSAGTGDYMALVLGNSRGTTASPTAVASGDVLAQYDAQGYIGSTSTYTTVARIRFLADGTPVDNSSAPGRIVFQTVPSGSLSPADRLCVVNAGNTQLTQNLWFGWTGSTDPSASPTTTISQAASGVVQIGTTGANASGTLRVTTVQAPASTTLNLGGGAASQVTIDSFGDTTITQAASSSAIPFVVIQSPTSTNYTASFEQSSGTGGPGLRVANHTPGTGATAGIVAEVDLSTTTLYAFFNLSSASFSGGGSGTVTQAAQCSFNTTATNGMAFETQTSTGHLLVAPNAPTNSNLATFAFTGGRTGLQASAGQWYGWVASTDPTASPTTTISQASSGVMQVGTSGANALGTLKLAGITSTGVIQIGTSSVGAAEGFFTWGSSSTVNFMEGAVAGDSFDRVSVNVQGTHYYGPGTAGADVLTARYAASSLGIFGFSGSNWNQPATFSVYNTSDITTSTTGTPTPTNSERVDLTWTSNIALLAVIKTGTGTQRALDVLCGSGAASTSAVAGYISTQAGAGVPTGTPTNSLTGSSQLYVNTTAGSIYGYYAGAWHSLGGSGGGSGTLILNESTKTTTYTITSSDYLIRADATSGAFTVSLPAAASVSGQVFEVKKIDGSVNAVTLQANGSETIDGTNTQAITTPYQSITVMSNGTSWDTL